MVTFLKSLFLHHLAIQAAAADTAPSNRSEEADTLGRRLRPVISLERVYVCHPEAVDPRVTTRRVRRICRRLVANGQVPIAPQLYLPTFLEPEEHALALALRFELVGVSHELRVYGHTMTSEMRREIDHATAIGLPVRFMEHAS